MVILFDPDPDPKYKNWALVCKKFENRKRFDL